jgi:hypothetical protein
MKELRAEVEIYAILLAQDKNCYWPKINYAREKT